MKNLQFFFTFTISILHLLNFTVSSQLDDFLKSFEKAHENIDFKRQKRSPSIEELLSRFNDDQFDDDEPNLEAGDAWYQSFRAMECRYGGGGTGCSKRPLRWKSNKDLPEEEDYDEDYEEEDEPILQDQWESTKNDLSHEANYKLSKMEQDAVERNLPKTAWPIRHSNSKRNVNPMQAVKLMTSLKMLQNGEGAALPSSFLAGNSDKTTVDEILESSKQDENLDPWKEDYEVIESRKLLSIVDKEEQCKSKNCLKHGIDVDQFDNLNQKTDFDRKFEDLTFDNVEPSKVSKKGTLSTLSDSLMKSDAMVKLQNFIRGKTSSNSVSNKTNLASKSTTIRPTTSYPLNLVDNDRDVNIKLHMSVNATVLGNNKMPERFHKNNSILFKPQKERKHKKTDRIKRRVVFPILTSTSKRKTNEEISKSVADAADNFPLDALITGKLTSQLVNTIFSFVKTSPNLKILWPGLAKNKISSPKQVQNFYAIRNHDNESEMHRTELMLRQAMETINAIIEQQVRSRSCVPLRSDLKDFYNLILATRAENDQFRDRRKRDTSATYFEETPMDDSDIRQKSRIVKKLLKDYEELPREEQDKIANIKESLLLAAEDLQELEAISRRRKRQLFTNHLLNEAQNATVLPMQDVANFTPQYLKLSRTAEMLLHNSLKDNLDLTIEFDSI